MSESLPGHDEQERDGMFYYEDGGTELYEDFLQRIGPERAQQLAEGDCHLASTSEGMKYMEPLLDMSRGDFEKLVEEMTDVGEMGQIHANLEVLTLWISTVQDILKKRGRDIHHAVCETCRKNYKRDQEIKEVFDRIMENILKGDVPEMPKPEDEEGEAWKS